MKEMTSVATTMMTEEEKSELERELNGGTTSPASPSISGAPATPLHPQPDSAPVDAGSPSHTGSSLVSSSDVAKVDKDPLASKSPASSSTNLQTKDASGKKRQKITQDQKKKLQEIEDERRKKMEERVATLTTKLVERLRPFVESQHPGEKGDPETDAFEARMQREAEDLKLESFGVEVSALAVHEHSLAHSQNFLCLFCEQLLHTIGNVYIMKATSFMKSRKFLGMWVFACALPLIFY